MFILEDITFPVVEVYGLVKVEIMPTNIMT